MSNYFKRNSKLLFFFSVKGLEYRVVESSLKEEHKVKDMENRRDNEIIKLQDQSGERDLIRRCRKREQRKHRAGHQGNN